MVVHTYIYTSLIYKIEKGNIRADGNPFFFFFFFDVMNLVINDDINIVLQILAQ